MKSGKLSWSLYGLLFLTACGLNNTGNQSASTATSAAESSSNKITSEFAESLLLPTAMSRMSGIEAVSKVIELFPTAVVDNPNGSGAFTTSVYPINSIGVQVALRSAASTDQINPEAFYGDQRGFTVPSIAATQAYTSIVALSAIDRSSGPLSLLSARTFFENLCTQAQLTPAKTVLFSATTPSSILLPGESLPTDPDTQLAFIVARRAWNYPYTADSNEVQHLKEVYTSSTTANQKKQVCLAALLSDQFWQGNPGAIDIANHVSLALGGKRPTLQQAVQFSTDPAAFKQYLKDLQSTSTYIDTILRWHGSRLGLRPLVTPPLSYGWDERAGEITEMLHESWYFSAGNFGAANSTPLGKIVETYMHGIDGCASPAKANQNWLASITAQIRGGVAPDMNQAFDPRTTGFFWEQYDASDSQNKVVAGWVLKPFLSQYKTAVADAALSDSDFITKYSCTAYTVDPRWLQCKGQLYNGVRYSLDQIRDSTAVVGSADPNCADCTVFSTASLPAPPKDTTIADGNGRLLRRAVRYSPSGRQDGYSEVRGFFTNKPIKACNSLARFLTTCAYRAPTGYEHQDWWDSDTGRSKGLFAQKQWTAAGIVPAYKGTTTTKYVGMGPFRQSRQQGNPGTPALETYAQPMIVEGFRCGEPDTNALSSKTTLDTKAAFPGYEYLPDYKTGDESVTTWLPATWKTSYAAVGSGVLHNRMFRVIPASDRYVDANHPSEYVWDSLYTEMTREPYALLQAAITNKNPVDGTSIGSKPDYSLIVKANYTFIPKYLEVIYRTRGESAYYPKGYSISDTESYTDMNQVFTSGDQNKFSELPARIVAPAATDGTYAYDRSPAGILQMPAIIGAMAPGGARSMSSRVFARFLCGDANIYDPNVDGAMDLHMQHFHRMNTVSSTANPMGGISSDPAQGSSTINTYKNTMTNFINNHANRPECMTCHSNLDPLGLALFKYYGTNLAAKQQLGSQMSYVEINTPKNSTKFSVGVNSTYSDSTMGTGAFLGEEVKGFSGVADKLSRSRLFYSCAAQDAFQNMFGRMPTSIEARKAYKNVIDRFTDDKDYNNMILGLVEIEQNLGGE